MNNNCKFCQKNAKIRDGKKMKTIFITTKNYANIYYQILEEAFWHLGLKNLKNSKNFQKTWKNCKN